MIGDKELFSHLYYRHPCQSIFVMVGDAPKSFNPLEQNFELPEVFTEQTIPNKLHLAYLKGRIVHLIQLKSASDEFYFKWYTHLLTIGLKTLLAIDSDNQLFMETKNV